MRGGRGLLRAATLSFLVACPASDDCVEPLPDARLAETLPSHDELSRGADAACQPQLLVRCVYEQRTFMVWVVDDGLIREDRLFDEATGQLVATRGFSDELGRCQPWWFGDSSMQSCADAADLARVRLTDCARSDNRCSDCLTFVDATD